MRRLIVTVCAVFNANIFAAQNYIKGLPSYAQVSSQSFSVGGSSNSLKICFKFATSARAAHVLDRQLVERSIEQIESFHQNLSGIGEMQLYSYTARATEFSSSNVECRIALEDVLTMEDLKR